LTDLPDAPVTRTAQQPRSNSALQTRTNHHSAAVLLWGNGLLHKGSWWVPCRGSLDGMQGVRVQIPSAPPHGTGGRVGETLLEVISDAGHPAFNSAVAKVTMMAKDEHGAGFVGYLRTTL
jgi:hypothetical protein